MAYNKEEYALVNNIHVQEIQLTKLLEEFYLTDKPINSTDPM